MHVVVIRLHRWGLTQLVPLRDVFHVRSLAAPSRLDVEDGDTVGCLIGPGVFVFDLQVALEAALRPQHHVMGIVFKFRTGHQRHALRAVRHGADFAVEKPLLLPIRRTGIGKNFRPHSACRCLFERSLVRSGIGLRFSRRRIPD